ncbi:nicotinate phosphoribosyltransferase [Acidaminococcus intestini]|uniref:nicotinate phosphoribosyltransferase n=1 Tax=Acidaminococcus intestini TaxID=187327 RepID=UPI003AB7A452
MQSDERNLSLVMDLYEMTMANGYFSDGLDKIKKVTFDVFYRNNPDNGGYAIFAGLEQVLELVKNFHFSKSDVAYFRSLHLFSEEFLTYLESYHFHGDIDALPEGTVMYPHEPILTVTAPMLDAQLLETAILAEINHQSLIATKTNRIVRAAQGRVVSDFGARRAHNMDAAVYGARAAYIGRANGTATVFAGKEFGIPVGGTMAHSWVMYFDDEFEAFKKYAEIYPDNVVLLIDTYDVIHSGLPNAIRTAKEILHPMGKRLKGVRIDSGDLAYLSKRVRKILDDEGLHDCQIVASNSLDEYTIRSILDQGGRIDSFGVGERLITAKSDPVFGAVYKLVAVENQDKTWTPRIKVSESIEKITNPGRKDLYRIYNSNGKALCDLIACEGETVDLSAPFRYVDPKEPWRLRHYTNCTAKALKVPVVRDGKVIYQTPSLDAIREFVRHQLTEEIWEEEQRFENPHPHFMDMTPAYYEEKMQVLAQSRKGR